MDDMEMGLLGSEEDDGPEGSYRKYQREEFQGEAGLGITSPARAFSFRGLQYKQSTVRIGSDSRYTDVGYRFIDCLDLTLSLP